MDPMKVNPHVSFGDVAADAIMSAADRARTFALTIRGAESRRLATPVGRVHLVDVRGEGSMPPVVMLHGLSSSATDYGPMMRRVRRWSRRVIAPDLPGHGLSEAPPPEATTRDVVDAIGRALDEVLDEPAVLFGNSLGGFAAIRYALRRSGRVSGLFLLSPAGAWSNATEFGGLLDALQVDDLSKARAFVRRVLPSASWSSARHNVGLLAWGVRVRMGRPSVRRLIARASEEDLLDPSELSAMDMPITLIWGRRERLLPRSHFEFFRRHFPPHARYEMPPSFGHAPFIDHPAEVDLRFRTFCRAVAAQGGRSTLQPDWLAEASKYAVGG